MSSKIIAIDLDGTLAHYDGWKGEDHIGNVIPEMVAKMHAKIAEGYEFEIFTARVSPNMDFDVKEATNKYLSIMMQIQDWCHKNSIPYNGNITCIKKKYFVEFWDDRAVHVVKNTGLFQQESDELNSAPQIGI